MFGSAELLDKIFVEGIVTGNVRLVEDFKEMYIPTIF